MKNTFATAIFILGLSFSNSSFSQYTKQSDIDGKSATEEIAKVNWYLDKTFWIMAKPKAAIRMEFFEQVPTQFMFSKGKFFVDRDTSFIVLDKVVEGSSDYISSAIFKIKFADGVEAYVRGDQLQRSKEAILGHLSNGIGEASNMEYVYEEPPKKLKARLAALPKKAGIRIGMTASEVRVSSWGKPKEINRTTSASGVREQWVYSGGYIYLTNGVVTAIQN